MDELEQSPQQEEPGFFQKNKTKLIQVGLFIITLIATTISGAEWIHAKSLVWSEDFTFGMVMEGLKYSIPFLLFLTCHEFGHYLTARYYRVAVTLPYYIPFWIASIVPAIGTMGAFIRIKGAIKTRTEFFDIGISGPLAGFVIAFGVLWYGFTHLPEPEYILDIHPEYRALALEKGKDYNEVAYSPEFMREAFFYQDSIMFKEENPEQPYQRPDVDMQGGIPSIQLGTNLLFEFFKNFVVEDPSRIPNSYEIIHYPLLLAGFLALFFTALNLLPIGQLDGGHIIYGLFGTRNHRIISTAIFLLFIGYAGIGLSHPYMSQEELVWMLPFHVLTLYVLTSGLKVPRRDRWMIIAVLFVVQHFIIYVFPNVEGYPGWLVFGFVLGRFLGIYHPAALQDKPLDRNRQILGWISLIVFILCFSPRPFIVSTF